MAETENSNLSQLTTICLKTEIANIAKNLNNKLNTESSNSLENHASACKKMRLVLQ